MKTIHLKITSASPNVGPFKITTDTNVTLATEVSLSVLVVGLTYEVEDNVNVVTLTSNGDCEFEKNG